MNKSIDLVQLLEKALKKQKKVLKLVFELGIFYLCIYFLVSVFF